jgi:hypothetical protein
MLDAVLPIFLWSQPPNSAVFGTDRGLTARKASCANLAA